MPCWDSNKVFKPKVDNVHRKINKTMNTSKNKELELTEKAHRLISYRNSKNDKNSFIFILGVDYYIVNYTEKGWAYPRKIDFLS